MSQTVCPNCGTEGSGRFCAECGASLGTSTCASCGATPPAGARYCTSCGARLGAGSEPARAGGRSAPAPVLSSGLLGWVTAGLLLAGLLVVVGLPALREGPRGPAGPGTAPVQSVPGNAAAVDLSSMSPREAADRLFDRIVRSQEAGDSVGVVSFLPMAIGAYERARPLDADGRFHLSLLQRLSFDFDAALATAREVLNENPNHLLALHAAAEAALAAGSRDEAVRLFTQFQDVYEAEVASALPEYQAHQMLLEPMREDARSLLAGER